jgi:hypothetical protein
MTGNVHSLREGTIVPGQPDEYCVRYLEELLHLARIGEITGVLVVAQHSDECTSWEKAGTYKVRPCLGALLVMQTQIALKDVTEQ